FSPATFLINATQPGNVSVKFNLTSPATPANATFNATANYTYPGGKAKTKRTNFTVESARFAILEIIRETPETVAKFRVFESAFIIYNKGCAPTSSSTLITESVASGYTPANPTSEGAPELLSSSVDLENNIITWNFSTIQVNQYAIARSQMRSIDELATEGNLQYNVSWDSKSLEEDAFKIRTYNYTNESYIEFDLVVYEKTDYPIEDTRSIQPNITYNYSLKPRNIGDVNTSAEWNVTLTIPADCTVVESTGTFDPAVAKINWSLMNLAIREFDLLNFSLTCTKEEIHVLTAEAQRSTFAFSSFSNATSISCEGEKCNNPDSFLFNSPNKSYERLSEINMTIYYNWSAHNLTIGEMHVNMTDDTNTENLIWQDFSFIDAQYDTRVNYSIDLDDQETLKSSSYTIGVSSSSIGTINDIGNTTVENITYTWTHGRAFSNKQNIFMQVNTFLYSPIFENLSVIPNSSGWGTRFNFTVFVRDRFSRNVSIYGADKKVGGSYTFVNTSNCTYCENLTQVNFSDEYECGDIGQWIFKFNASNADGWSENESSVYTLVADITQAYNITPIFNATVNRSQETNFTIRVYDAENASSPYELRSSGTDTGQGLIKITTYANNDTFDTSPEISSNDTGYINRAVTNAQWCVDTDKYVLGQMYYKGGVEDATCYQDNVTQIVPFMLMGTLNNTLELPSGLVNFTRGDTISFSATVEDDCSVARISDSDINFTMTNNNGTEIREFSCIADANGDCDIITTSSFPVGLYNVTVTSNKTYHNNGVQTNNSQFFLGVVPLLLDPRAIPSTGGWGESPFNFTINVTNLDNATTNVSFYLREGTGSFSFVSSKTCTICDNTEMSFEYNFTESNIDDWRFRFIANDSIGFLNDTEDIYGTEMNFTVERDDINIQVLEGNETEINRSDSQSGSAVNLTAMIYDTDNSSYTNNTNNETAFFTYIYNGSSYLEVNEIINQTNFTYEFNPGCTYEPGLQTWMMNVTNAAYYKNQTTGPRNITIWGDLTTEYISPTGLQVYEGSTIITLLANVTDDCLNSVTGSTVDFLLNTSGTTYNCTSPGNATGLNYYCNFNTTGKQVGNYNVTVTASKTYHKNGTDTETDALKIIGTPDLFAADALPRTDGWGVPRTFSVNVSDNDEDNVTVYLWERPVGGGEGDWTQVGSPQVCQDCTNVVINWTDISYICDDIESKEFKFNATDEEGNTYTTTVGSSDYIGDSNSFTIEADNVWVEYVQGNETNATLESSTQLIVRVYDIDNSTYGLVSTGFIGFNITKSGQGTTYSLEGANSTNSTGHVIFDFLPDQSYAVMKQDWIAFVNTTTAPVCYKYNDTDTYNVTTLTNAPRVENESIDTQSGGWGVERIFSLNVTDTHNNATVYLWKASSVSGPWSLLTQQDYNNTNITTRMYFAVNFTPDDDKGTFFYKFNISNTIGNLNTTAEVATNNYTITRDTLTYQTIVGNNSISNRSGSQITFLSVRVYDTDNQTYVSTINVTFTINLSSSSIDAGFQNETNTTGHANYYFDPGCSPTYTVGDRAWKMEISDEDDYFDITLDHQNISIIGDILLDLIKPDGTLNYTQEDVISFLGVTEDDCEDVITPTVRYYLNQTDDKIECTNVTAIGGNVFSCDLTTNLTTPQGWYNASMYANISNHYINTTENWGELGRFFLSPKLKLLNPLIEPNSTGWGERNITFSVNVSSGDSEEIYNISVWMNKGSPAFSESCQPPTCLNITTTICDQCTSQIVTWIRNFTSDDQGTWFVQFRFNDSDNTRTSGNDILELEEDDVFIDHTKGNDSITNRSSNQITSFVVLVNDSDKGSVAYTPSTKISFNVTVNGTDFIINGTDRLTNTTGHANTSFNPNCVFDVGPQTWFAYVSDSDTNYKSNNSINYTTTIIGDLYPQNIQIHVNGSYTNVTNQVGDGDYINITGDVVDDCNNYRNDSNINVTFMIWNATHQFFCPTIINLNNGSYQCEWDTSSTEIGIYNINMTAGNVSYHYNGTTADLSALGIETAPNKPPTLTNASSSPTTIGWGEEINISLDASDTESDTFNVSLWDSAGPAGPWSWVNNSECLNCTGSRINFTIRGRYNAFNIGLRYYMFNATDPGGSTGNTSAYNFTIERDEVNATIHIGNNTSVNRTEDNTTILGLNLFDTDNLTYVSALTNGTIWVTTDGSTFDSGIFNYTNSTRYFNVSFNPNCSYNVGPQVWRGGTNNDTTYNESNSTNMTVIIMGTLINNVTYPNKDDFNSTQNVTIQINITDYCNNAIAGISENITVEINHRTSWYNCSTINEEGGGAYNCTIVLENKPGGYYNITVNSSKQYYNDQTNIKIGKFFHQVTPEVSGQVVSPVNAPWGTTFYFNVTVTDEDDNVTLYLLDRKVGGGAWTVRDTQICYNCTGGVITLGRAYSAISDITEWEWFINATDTRNANNLTDIERLNVTKRTVIFDLVSGNDTDVNRTFSNTTTLTVRAIDNFTQAAFGAGIQGGIIITTDGSIFGSKLSNSTNSTGHIRYDFDPDCNYQVGDQIWIGSLDEQSGYYQSNSSNFTLQIYSLLYNNVTTPDGGSIQEGDSLEITGNVSDDCGGIAGATANYRIIQGANIFTCIPDPATDQGGGNYTCDFNTDGYFFGLYDIMINSSKSFYFNSSYRKNDSFRIGDTPKLRNPASNMSSEGWGYTFTFTISVEDDEPTDDVNITLLRSFSTSGPWTEMETQTCSGCTVSTEMQFYSNFTKQDLDSGPMIYFFFNGSDEINNFTNQSSQFNITLEKDNVTVEYVSGAGEEINRDGSNTGRIVIRIYDNDKGAYIAGDANATMWVTTDGSTYDSGYYTTVNSTGHVYNDFNPDCTYAIGIQDWIGGINNDTYYETTNMSIPRTLTVKGQLKNNLLNPTQGQLFNVSDMILNRFNTTSDCSDELPGEVIIANTTVTIELQEPQTETFHLCTPLYNESNGESVGHYNCTFNSTNYKEGNWSIRLNSSLTSFNSNSTIYLGRFWLENIAPLNETTPSVYPTSGGWSRSYNFTVNVSDVEGDNLTCILWLNQTENFTVSGDVNVTGTETTKECSVIYHSFTESDIGTTKEFKFEIRNGEPNNTLNTTTVSGPTIQASQVEVIYLLGNLSQVNRSGGNQTHLQVTVNDTENGSLVIGANVTFWVTTDGSTYDSGLTNTTIIGGVVSYWFNPNCNYNPGNQTWIAGTTDANYQYVNSTVSNLTIIGNLINTLITPSGEEYRRLGPDGYSQNVTIRGNVTDECYVPITTPEYINFTMTSLSSGLKYYCPINNETDGHYNCTVETNKHPRWYNITFNSSEEYHNNYSLITSNAFFIETQPNLTSPSVVSNRGNATGGWGSTWNFSVVASDDDNDTMTVRLYIRKTGGGSWLFKGQNTTVQGINQTVRFEISSLQTGGTDDISEWEYRFNVTEDDGWSDESDYGNFSAEKDEIELEYSTGNNENYNRSNTTETVQLQVRVKDTDNGNYLSGGTPGTGKYFVTTDPTDYENYTVDKTIGSIESSGYLTDDFPDSARCTYLIGPQRWFVEFGSTSTAYKATNSSIYNITIITPKLNTTIDYPANQTFLEGESILMRGNVTDDCGLVEADSVSIRAYNGQYRTCSSVNDEGTGWYNCTLDSAQGWTLGYYRGEMSATKTYYNDSGWMEKNDTFILVTMPEFQSVSLSTSDGSDPYGWGEDYTFYIEIRDRDQSTFGFEELNLSLYADKGSGWELVNSTICSGGSCADFNPQTFIQTNLFDCADLLVENISYQLNMTDYWGYSNYTNGTFTIERDNVQTSWVSGQDINRESGVGTFIFTVQDTDRSENPTNANVTFWFTTDGSNYDSGNYNQTNSTGHGIYNFDPDCSYEPGVQNWISGVQTDECYKDKNLSFSYTLTINGTLKEGLYNPLQDQIFNVSDQILIRANTTSDCTSEDVIPNATVTMELQNPTGQWYPCSTVYNETSGETTGWYNCTFDSTGHKEGNWSIRFNSTKQYFISNTTTWDNRFWLENIAQQNATEPSV
ncbi:hypothetical protein ACFLQN_04590, partial [Candidatus Aenigmatarchaeota archaeon]